MDLKYNIWILRHIGMKIPDFATRKFIGPRCQVMVPISMSEDNFLEFCFGMDILQISIIIRMFWVDFQSSLIFFRLLGN